MNYDMFRHFNMRLSFEYPYHKIKEYNIDTEFVPPSLAGHTCVHMYKPIREFCTVVGYQMIHYYLGSHQLCFSF